MSIFLQPHLPIYRKIQKCIEVGCDEYIAKPIDRRELLKTIGKYLPSKEPALIETADSVNS